MPLEVGPFVGVSSNEARILFEAVPEIRFLLGLGDQVYTDELWESKKSTGGEYYYNLSAAALLYEYKQAYYKYLHIPQVQRVTSHCPMFMTWDDHEIRDGWGSRGDETGAAEQKLLLAHELNSCTQV